MTLIRKTSKFKPNSKIEPEAKAGAFAHFTGGTSLSPFTGLRHGEARPSHAAFSIGGGGELGERPLWNRFCGNLLTFNAGLLRFGYFESQVPLSEIGPPEDNRRSDKNGRVRANNHSDYIGECEVGEHRTAEKQERKHANQSHAARKDRSTQGLVDACVHQILNRASSP